MLVNVYWQHIDDVPQAWGWNCALHAYQHPSTDEILYVGKADGTTVRARWNAADKEGFWRDLEQQRGIFKHGVLVGTIGTSFRLTRQLLADVESLLIFAMEPWGNIASRSSRITRPGLVVRNFGQAWPGPQTLQDTAQHVEFW